MSSAGKKKISNFKNIVSANLGCGCGKAKLQDISEPKPRPKEKSKAKEEENVLSQKPSQFPLSSSSSWETGGEDNTSTTTFSINNITKSPRHFVEHLKGETNRPTMVSPCPKITDSVAVVKDSDDPYQDFRQSMLQMIIEKEMYCKDDLQELLKCFLELNSPTYHDVIVQAFMEIWNGVVSGQHYVGFPVRPTTRGGGGDIRG